MDAARQVLRFSIPGSLLLLLTYGFIVGGRLLQHESLAQVADAADGNLVALTAILAAIPVGFVVYQFYYLSLQPFVRVGFRWGRRWPRIDRGASVLSIFDLNQLTAINRLFGVDAATKAEKKDAIQGSELVVEGPQPQSRRDQQPDRPIDAEISGTVDTTGLLEFLGVQRLSPTFLDPFGVDPEAPFVNREAYAKAANAYETRWYDNWDVLRALIQQVTILDGGVRVCDEYMTLSDVYHALGACRTASTLSWMVSTMIVLVCTFDHHAAPGRSILAILMSGFVSVGLWLVLNQTRRQTWKSAEMSLKYGLRYLLNRNPDLLNGAGSV